MTSRLSLSEVRRASPGWYRGDFHVHTDKSDGRYPPAGLAQLYASRKLDFFALTDHNSIGAFNDFGADPGLLIIPGLEVTLEEGHWNVFGLEGWLPWMDEVCQGKITIPLSARFSGTSELLELTRGGGCLNSINHPLLKPWEWRDPATDLRLVDAIEVWNDPLWPDNAQANPRAVDFWTECLNAGLRPTAIAGSDFHMLPGEAPPYPGEEPGLPLTWVYARELSAQAILEGVRQRRVYVSLGPQMQFSASLGDERFDIGSDMELRSGRARLKTAVTAGPQGGRVRLVGGAGLVGEAPLVMGQAELRAELAVRPDRPQWVRAEVVDEAGQMVALTNPIFAGPEAKLGLVTFGEIERRTEG